jgi:hypothetical protein
VIEVVGYGRMIRRWDNGRSFDSRNLCLWWLLLGRLDGRTGLRWHGVTLATGLTWPGLSLAWPGLKPGFWPGLAYLATAWPLAWPGLTWPGLAWPGLALAWPGLAWPGLAWPVQAWPGLALAWPGLAWP